MQGIFYVQLHVLNTQSEKSPANGAIQMVKEGEEK